jgi:predicted O-linked N-acetylglucosamine transferase (SPINDLY family)
MFNSWFMGKRTGTVKYYGYQQSVHTDSMTTSAQKACDQWREIYDIDPFSLSMTMQGDELDVLVDLSGVDWISRMTVMGLAPTAARVGVFTLPEPGFAPGITHILCDDVLLDADTDVLLANQQTVHLNGCLFARAPYSILRNDIPAPVERNGYITFGGIMDLACLSPECALMWADVLHAVPRSKLLLCGGEFSNDTVKQKIRDYFSHAGVIDRIVFPVPDEVGSVTAIETVEARIPNKHWEEIDIFLDTAPINCRAELCEALWTGAPVISLRSKRRNGLTGASILTAAKRLNWIAQSKSEFIELASNLGNDTENLKKNRNRLQENIVKSTLFDPKKLTSEIRRVLSELGRNSRIKTDQPSQN